MGSPETIMFFMHGFEWLFTMSLIHSLLHFSQTVFFFRSMRFAGHWRSGSDGVIRSLKMNSLPTKMGSLHIHASQRCSPLSAGRWQNAHFGGIARL